MSTVADVINEFLDRINQPREASYVGATSPAARQYLSLFKFIGGELLDFSSGWTQLKRSYVFTTTTGEANYQLPGDFLRPLIGTQWGVTNQIPLAGPLSNAQLAFQTYGVNIATPFAGYQINGAQGYVIRTSPYVQTSAGYFQISPPGQDNITQMVIVYMSNNYVWPTNWVASTAYSVGDLVTGINNIYICTDAITSSTTRPSVVSGDEADGDGEWTVYTESYPVSADTDIVILDDNLFIDGLRWAWYQSKKQDYQDLKNQWLSSVRSALGRQNGPCEVNAGANMNAGWQWPMVPQGNWDI